MGRSYRGDLSAFLGRKMFFGPRNALRIPQKSKIAQRKTGAVVGVVTVSYCDVIPRLPPGDPGGGGEFKHTLISYVPIIKSERNDTLSVRMRESCNFCYFLLLYK